MTERLVCTPLKSLISSGRGIVLRGYPSRRSLTPVVDGGVTGVTVQGIWPRPIGDGSYFYRWEIIDGSDVWDT